MEQGPGKKYLRWLLLATLSMVVLSGCKPVDRLMFKPAGKVVALMAEEVTVPYVMSTGDTGMSCAMSEAMTPFLLSLGKVIPPPDQLAVVVNMSAGACEEERALEFELASMRAIREQRPDEAQDAVIAQKRHLGIAAQRQYEAWKALTRYYEEEPGGECPSFDGEFSELTWLIGMISGLQALNNDLQSSGVVGVPKNIAAKVQRGAGCLVDNDWWGAPMAIKATVWTTLPGALPKGENAWERLDEADKKGEKARVRVAHVFHAMAAYGQGDTEMVKNVIRRHADQIKRRESNPDYKMIDRISTSVLTMISDRLWTENTGHRTPIGGLGTFWDDQTDSNVESVELDDLL